MPQNLKPIRSSLFLISLPMVFIMFGLPLRAEDLGASGFEIGILFSIFTSSLLILRPIVGIGLDRFGRRIFFLGGMVFYLFANSLYAFGDTITGLYIARTFHGIGFAILAISAETITADLTKRDDRASAMGDIIAFRSRGGMVGAFIGFGLVGLFPIHAWGYSFTIYAVIAALALVFAWRTIPETWLQDHKAPKKKKFSFSSKHYSLLVVIFLGAFAATIIQPLYLIYLRERFDVPVYILAAVFMPIGLVYALLPGMLGRLTNKLNRALSVSVGLSIAAIFYALVPHIEAFVLLISAFIGAAIANVLVDLTQNAWIGDIAKPQATGRTFGLAALVAGLGATTGPLLGGLIYDEMGKHHIFYAAAALYLLAALFAVGHLKSTSGTKQPINQP